MSGRPQNQSKRRAAVRDSQAADGYERSKKTNNDRKDCAARSGCSERDARCADHDDDESGGGERRELSVDSENAGQDQSNCAGHFGHSDEPEEERGKVNVLCHHLADRDLVQQVRLAQQGAQTYCRAQWTLRAASSDQPYDLTIRYAGTTYHKFLRVGQAIYEPPVQTYAGAGVPAIETRLAESRLFGIIGGLGSMPGAAIGSLIVGLGRAAAVHLFPQVELFVVYAVMASLNYIVQLTVVRLSILNKETDGLAMLVMGNPHSIFWALASAYVFMNLAMLFAAPVFEGGKLERCIRWLFYANGASVIVTIFGVIVDSPPIYLLGSLVPWCIVFSLATATSGAKAQVRFEYDVGLGEQTFRASTANGPEHRMGVQAAIGRWTLVGRFGLASTGADYATSQQGEVLFSVLKPNGSGVASHFTAGARIAGSGLWSFIIFTSAPWHCQHPLAASATVPFAAKA